MWTWIISLAVGAVSLPEYESLPVAPLDVVVGRQTVELRKPLVARAPGTRLVLYVRDLGNLGLRRAGLVGEFEKAVPLGSVTAYLSGAEGVRLVLEHTGYSYYRGYAGLVLTEKAAPGRNELYRELELDAKIPLRGVRVVWLDRLNREVRDFLPGL